MRRRLLLSYVSVVLVVLVALEVPLGVLFARHERDLLFTQAEEEATGLAVAAAEDLQRGHAAGLLALLDRYRAAGGGEALVSYGTGQTVDSDLDGGRDRAELAAQLAAANRGRSVTGAGLDEGRPFALAAVPIRAEVHSDAAGGSVIGALLLSVPASATHHRSRDVWLLLAGFGLVVLGLTALLGARLASSMSRPIAALERSVARLGAGDLTSRARPHGPPELRALAGEFNRMAGELERLVSAQAQFVADASHQLRSPLTALRLRLENLESSVEAGAAGSVAAANREVQRLSRLVDGLLTLSRADEDRPARRPVDVDAVIAERVEAWGALADERGVRLHALPDGLRDPIVALVPGDLEQILDNLLSNALEATPTGRSISVEATESGGGIDVAVNDEGVGMDDEERARAFDRFWQGPGQGTGTSGLGLAIVRQVARRNSASVELLPGPPVSGTPGGRGAGRGISAIVHLDR